MEHKNLSEAPPNVVVVIAAARAYREVVRLLLECDPPMLTIMQKHLDPSSDMALELLAETLSAEGARALSLIAADHGGNLPKTLTPAEKATLVVAGIMAGARAAGSLYCRMRGTTDATSSN